MYENDMWKNIKILSKHLIRFINLSLAHCFTKNLLIS